MFDHALRVRFNAETKKQPASSHNLSGNSNSAIQEAEGAGDDISGRVDPEAESQAAIRDNLIGKISNLVTSDVENINQGRDFLVIGEEHSFGYDRRC